MACASNPEVLQSALKEKDLMGCIPFKCLLYSNCSSEELFQADDKADYSAVLKSSSSRTSKPLPEQTGCIKAYQDLEKIAFPEKTLHITENYSKEASSEKGSVSMGNTITNSVECSNSKSLLEGTGINGLYLAQDTGSIGRITVPLDNSKSMDARKSRNSTVDSKLRPTASDGNINVSSTIGILSAESSASSLDLKSFEKNASLLATKSTKIPEFQLDAEKEKKAGTLRRSLFESSKRYCNGDAMACLSRSSNQPIPNFDLPPIPSALRGPTKVSKSLHHTSKPSISLSKTSNKTLKEILPALEGWARKGLDHVFNASVEFGTKEVGTNLEKDIKYGLDVMKEMATRMYTLMRGVNQMPDFNSMLLPALEMLRSDLNKTMGAMWNIIDDIELQVYGDSETLKLACCNVLGEGTVEKEQEAKPNIHITNAYTIVTEKLPLLRKLMADFREKLRIFCSEIENLL